LIIDRGEKQHDAFCKTLDLNYGIQCFHVNAYTHTHTHMKEICTGLYKGGHNWFSVVQELNLAPCDTAFAAFDTGGLLLSETSHCDINVKR
jgi:hypothetical protein